MQDSSVLPDSAGVLAVVTPGGQNLYKSKKKRKESPAEKPAYLLCGLAFTMLI